MGSLDSGHCSGPHSTDQALAHSHPDPISDPSGHSGMPQKAHPVHIPGFSVCQAEVTVPPCHWDVNVHRMGHWALDGTMEARPSPRGPRTPQVPAGRTYVFGVPGPVAQWLLGQEGDVSHEDGQQQQGTDHPPGQPPVGAGPPPGHPCNVIAEPAPDAGLRLHLARGRSTHSKPRTRP